MLVKLGTFWVDPQKVVSISDELGVSTAENNLHLVGGIDAYASIINEALQTQSFGGEIHEEKESV